MITWLGVLLIPYALLVSLFWPSKLKHAAIFFIPFTATSVFNMPSGVPITPFQLFGSFFIALSFLNFIKNHKQAECLIIKKTQLFLILFLLSAVISTFMPLWIDGALTVSSNTITDLRFQKIVFTASGFKRVLPIIFGVAFSFAICADLNSPKKITDLVKTYVASALFVSIWGLLQFALQNILSIEYPYYVFNNIEIEAAQGYVQKLNFGDTSIYRISSVSHEPSIFAKYLLSVIPLVLFAILFKQPILGRVQDKIAIFVIVFVLLLSTSFIGYVGFIGICVLTILFFRKYCERKSNGKAFLFLSIMSFLSLLLISPSAIEVFSVASIEKFQSGSFLERILSVVNSYGYFIEYPILGVGWALVTSHDLIMNLLVNSGVVGFLTFTMFSVSLFWTSMKKLDYMNENRILHTHAIYPIFIGVTISFAILILSGIVTGLEFYNGNFYFIVALLISCGTNYLKTMSGRDMVRTGYGKEAA